MVDQGPEKDGGQGAEEAGAAAAEAVVALRGDVGVEDARRAAQEARAHLAAGAREVALDLSGVDHFSTDALGALLSLSRAAEAAGARLVLCALAPPAERKLRRLGALRLFADVRPCEGGDGG